MRRGPGRAAKADAWAAVPKAVRSLSLIRIDPDEAADENLNVPLLRVHHVVLKAEPGHRRQLASRAAEEVLSAQA